jgi:glycosyltransferase involved in cell wall biosynthesis
MVSAVILTKNEEDNIKECLSNLSWCEEIIVIDDNSTDKTIEIAKKTKAKVFSHALNRSFSEQRNFGLEKAKGDWILFIDADERVSSALWYEIMAITNDPISKHQGYYLKRKDILWGKELAHGETGDIRILRLAKKNAGRWEGYVHEVWKIKGNTPTLQNPLIHYPHQTVKDFLAEINHYSDLRAQELFKKKIRTTKWAIVLYPCAKFFLNYVAKLGFLDGIPGLVFTFMMSFHSFLVRGKLWLLWEKEK